MYQSRENLDRDYRRFKLPDSMTIVTGAIVGSLALVGCSQFGTSHSEDHDKPSGISNFFF